MHVPGFTPPTRGVMRLYVGDRCPECGEPLLLRERRSVLAFFRKHTVLQCPVCNFVAMARRRSDKAAVA
jgi:predicted RNA-binding Zn-ribbon protein involved in translation (DUF1610 family)